MKPNELCVFSLHLEVKNVFFERYCIIIANLSVRCVYMCTWGYGIMILSRTRCGWVWVGVCVCGIYVCCVGFSRYRKCVISLFVLILYLPFFSLSPFFNLHLPSSLFISLSIPLSSFPTPVICLLSLWIILSRHPSLPRILLPCPLFSLIPPTPADLHPFQRGGV